MMKLDLEATLVEIRKAMEASAAMSGQDPAELAANQGGIDAQIAFARWGYQQRELLEAEDYIDAIGMLLCSMLIGAVTCVSEDGRMQAIERILQGMLGGITRFAEGEVIPGDGVVAPIMRDVGDA